MTYSDLQLQYNDKSVRHAVQQITLSCHVKIGTVSLQVSIECVRVSEAACKYTDCCMSTITDAHHGPILHEAQRSQGGEYSEYVPHKNSYI